MRIAWGVDIRLARMYDSATTICVKTSHSLVTVLAPNVLVADVFGTGICH